MEQTFTETKNAKRPSGAKEVLDFTPYCRNLPWRDVVSLSHHLEVSSKWSPGLREWRCPEASVLCQSCHERPSDWVPKVREAGVGSLHHLEEAQALLLNLPDHSPHWKPPEEHHGKSESDWKDIKMGLRAQVPWTQIWAEDYDRRLEPSRLHRWLHPGTTEHTDQLKGWILNIDRASNSKGQASESFSPP